MIQRIVLYVMLVQSALFADTWNIALDNDLLFGSDDSYTGGGVISWMSSRYEANSTEYHNGYINFIRQSVEMIPFVELSHKELHASISLQEVIITPSDINATEPNYDDLPYVGYLGSHFSLFASDDTSFDQYRFSLGIIGENSGAEWIQTKIHELINNDPPRGWDNQLGPQFMMGLGYLHGTRSYEKRLFYSVDFEWFNSYYGDVGNVLVDIGAGSMVRFGQNMPRNFIVFSTFFNNTPSQILNLDLRPDVWGWAVDMGMSANYIPYFYLFEAAKEEGYNFYTPSVVMTAKMSLNLFIQNVHMSLDLFPTGTAKENSHTSSWGRFSVSWYIQ
ncbi:MAG: lipid A deacylase LpxR family protein [Campylobacterota bacterium]|nr:lipid A deacylase LpxR family protein [Campylobacterota bacterium]